MTVPDGFDVRCGHDRSDQGRQVPDDGTGAVPAVKGPRISILGPAVSRHAMLMPIKRMSRPRAPFNGFCNSRNGEARPTSTRRPSALARSIPGFGAEDGSEAASVWDAAEF